MRLTNLHRSTGIGAYAMLGLAFAVVVVSMARADSSGGGGGSTLASCTCTSANCPDATLPNCANCCCCRPTTPPGAAWGPCLCKAYSDCQNPPAGTQCGF